MKDNAVEKKIAAPGKTRGIGAALAIGVVGGVASRVADAVTQQVISKVRAGGKKET